jgi:release factor glutamine methyltransferase
MRKIFKRVVSFFLVPLTRWYLRKERSFTYLNTTVTVPPGVFHPGLFYSTKFLIDYLQEHSIKGQKLLELGCGTGLLSILASKAGAVVTASDLSQAAVDSTMRNAHANGTAIQILHSDLFDAIPKTDFDWIMINPPYYSWHPANDAELAWNCGEDFEYFRRLFPALRNYTHTGTNVIMVLTLGSELEKIFSIGRQSGIEFELIRTRGVLFDRKDFLFRVRVENC